MWGGQNEKIEELAKQNAALLERIEKLEHKFDIFYRVLMNHPELPRDQIPAASWTYPVKIYCACQITEIEVIDSGV